MDATQELSLVPTVQLQQKYWVTEDSKAKLLMVGAKCLDIVSHRERYYDTTSDDLAMAQLWLSQKNQQWCLILEPQEQVVKDNTANPGPEVWELSCQNKTENGQAANPALYKSAQEKRQIQFEPNDQNDHQHDLNKMERTYVCATSSSAYNELVGEREIITHLADFLHIDLKPEEEGNITMEDFLQKAGIQQYASNHIVNQTTYMLCNQYMIIIQRDESSLKESATVLLDVDILNICRGFEEIEKLANYLKFEHQAVQSEQERSI
ncbi:uncharacterized protein LOC133374004 [Rhineura floridana]|uniref:uncharacterized protein LOC133374004 n=1 Tax=Rhineura floridana TaxID=261503 RepID=UPI002AC89423|nr:uncharacterized protein LOC133374004 [Rhineura floridana]